MSLWDLCDGKKLVRKIEVSPWRIVEAQHISSSRDLVDSRAEHDLLEELLEKSKPPIMNERHYLIFTAFRYPPLKYGSRFGKQYEPSLWYGSLDLNTAFAEVAYYRLKFFNDTEANLGYMEILMTAFKAYIKTENGIDLTQGSFSAHQDKISHAKTYEYSQPLGTEMRHAGIEAFIFTSARAKSRGKNVAAFTQEVFIKRENQYITDMQSWRCVSNKNVIEFSRCEILVKERISFSIDDFMPF